MLAAQLCLTLCHPVDCSSPGSSIHGIFQARILERVVIPFSRESYPPRDQPRSPALQADSLLSGPAEKPKHGQWQAPSSTVSKLRTDGTAPAKRLTSRRRKKGRASVWVWTQANADPPVKDPQAEREFFPASPFSRRGLHLIGWGPPTVGRAICFTLSTDVHVTWKLFPRHSQGNNWLAIWAPVG